MRKIVSMREIVVLFLSYLSALFPIISKYLYILSFLNIILKNHLIPLPGTKSTPANPEKPPSIQVKDPHKPKNLACRHQPGLSSHYIEITAAINANNPLDRTPAVKGTVNVYDMAKKNKSSRSWII